MEQHNHYSTEFNSKKFPVTVVCDAVYFQQNIGSIFRVCEAFGIEKIIFTGENFVFSERKINKTSRQTHKTVPYEVYLNKAELIQFLAKADTTIIALEITTQSKPIANISLTNKPLTLLIGSEIYGISKELLLLASNSYHIEMYGKNSSMNVVQSLGIALYSITQKMQLNEF